MESQKITVAIIIIAIILILVCVLLPSNEYFTDNCSDPIRQVKVNEDTLNEGMRQYSWSKENDKNYIGLNKCRKGIFNYGKKTSAYNCENTCKADPYCNFWTYNQSADDFGYGAIGDCRGHDFMSNNEIPYKKEWKGFVSGQRI